MAGKPGVYKQTGIQKVAIFLLNAGEDYASKVFKNLSNDEIKRVATAMSKFEQISPEVLNAVTEEFNSIFENDDQLFVGGEHFVKNVVNNTLDSSKANEIVKNIEEKKRSRPFIWSRDVDPHTFAGHIEGEHPQTVAMILANLPPDIAAEILMVISDEKKGDIALRIAQLGSVSEDILRDVDDTLRDELKNMGTSGGKAGGIDALVEIINNVDKASEDVIIETIEEDHEEMATDIRQRMFIFEDILNVDDRGMREILKKVESSQLTLALKTASEEMKQKIFTNLSSRVAEILMEDLELMGPVKLSEVEEAQRGIVNAARELEADGAITLGGKGRGKEDVLV